eukprot:TRINITY_DN43988_c0_g1_i1.p1 TRINITY_DN43988_c0_g1~~TRINITY_DN43988_c0_g1_i1.p1  ORF type:complete len:1074 (+),score=197.91 TRINITY_DN43988_c0_g1_i1:112-3222(+)
MENARSMLNQQLQKWKQSTEMQVEAEGPPHAMRFTASIRFHVPKLGRQLSESHTSLTKKSVQNELALKLCRRLYTMNLLPKYTRSVRKSSSFLDSVKESKYHEAGAFSVSLSPSLKARLSQYLASHGIQAGASGQPRPKPGSVLFSRQAADQGQNDVEAAPAQGEDGVFPMGLLEWTPPGSPGAARPWPWQPGHGSARTGGGVSAEVRLAQCSLPIAEKREQIVEMIRHNQVCIVRGSTGCGKTTQVPQYILDDIGTGLKAIVVAQPRRLAAITVAQRVAAERGEALGQSVGYAVRFDAVWPRPHNGVCFMTTGLLLKRLHRRGLHGISHIIVDEVHERDLHNDLLLSLLRVAVASHPEELPGGGLKIILMSATIDVSKFQNYMSAAVEGLGMPPAMLVEGRTFPVETYYMEDAIEMLRWQPPPSDKKGKDKWHEKNSMNTVRRGMYSPSTEQALCGLQEQQIPMDLIRALVVHVAQQQQDGSVLIFMPAWAYMSALLKILQADPALGERCRFVMLHSHVPREQQAEAFRPVPAGTLKVVIATNIAESSVTIDDAAVVIDSCRVKVTFFSETTGLSHSSVVWTGIMNLEQRKGRTGRTRPGVCFRLCTRRRFDEGIDNEIAPELTRTPLLDTALLVKSLGLGDVRSVLQQCLDPPALGRIEHALAELRLFGAITARQELTPLGRILGRLPVDPRIGLALLMGHWLFRLGDAMSTICAAMSFDEPFPYEKTAGYLPWSFSEKYAGNRKNSDQYVLGQVHQNFARCWHVEGEAAALKHCNTEGLHPAIMRQVKDAAGQLRSLLISQPLGGQALEDAPLEADDTPEVILPPPQATFDAIRDWDPREWHWGAMQLLLAMALPHIGVHQEKRMLWVSEDTHGQIHKGSVNCNKTSYVFPSPLFSFLDQAREGWGRPPRCRQLTNTPPLFALLRPFAPGEVLLDEEGNHAIIGGWIPIGPVQPDTASLLLGLRQRLEDVMRECAEAAVAASPEDVGKPTFKDKELLIILRDLLCSGNHRSREGNNQGRPRSAPPTSVGWQWR